MTREGYGESLSLKMNGFSKRNSLETIQKFKTTISVASENIDTLWTETEIKQKLATQLMLELQENGYIDFISHKNVASFATQYTSQISVAKFHDLEYAYVDKYGYFLEDKEFSLKEIEEAIKNTFPERFLT
jgi:Holliday junction resolvasome RuvABC DNA-binding subunit